MGRDLFGRLRYIIWPGVRNITILVVIVTVLAFTNGSFDLVNILTQGGPINATTTLIYYIYFAVSTTPAWLRGSAFGAPARDVRGDSRGPRPRARRFADR